jgi:glycosyltransferase involved in cell wall biosynthesis
MVSVIIPAYNHGSYLPRSVSSVLAQTYTEYEVIVIDDGSTDDTPACVAGFIDQIRYHHQENSGLGAARNKGLALARGEYVQFLDADDSIAPEKFEMQVPALAADESISVVYSDYANLDSNQQMFGETSSPLSPGESPLWRLIRENFMPVHSPLVRRESLLKEGGFDESRDAQEDWDLWLRLASRGHKFQYYPGVFAYYHRDGSRMTSNSDLMYRRGQHLLNKISADPVFRTLEGGRLFEEFCLHQHLSLASRSYNQKKWSTARSHILKAIKARPKMIDLNTWLLLLKTMIRPVFIHF